MKDDISFVINISKESFINSIEGMINHPHKKIIAEAIVNNLSESSTGLDHLYKALLGIAINTKYNVGDIVYVQHTALPTWRMDMDKTITYQDYIKCEINGINLYRNDPFTVTFAYVDKLGNEVTDEYNVKESHLQPCDDNDLDLE
jgi:hypothetical protein